MRNSLLIFALGFLPALAAADSPAVPVPKHEPPPDAALAERIARVEHGLLPAARIAGAKSEPWTLATRMALYKVPGVSVAVIDHGVVAWARGYGVARAGDEAPVTPETLFQAGSISKPVTAAAALTFVDAEQLALDTEVNEKLRSWKIPASPLARGEPVTLRRLLSHTAGITIHGFVGYVPGVPRPTLLQVLNGAPPANSSPIRIFLPPGAQWRYSGGGYCIVQQLLLDLAGTDFPTLVRERVLQPAGMTSSTFEQPLPAALAAHAAAGHHNDGSRLDGDAHVFPELAAAGLWTTPTDLARFVLAVQQAFAGQPGFLSPATARQMLRPPLAGSDYGLGIGVKGDGENLCLSHGGDVEGFHCSLVSYPRLGRGAVVMTNGDYGPVVIGEILRAVAHEYDWPDYHVVEKTAAPFAPEAFDAFAGRYEREETTLQFSRLGNRYFLRATGEPRREIFPSSDHEFFLLNSPDTFSFERDAGGHATHLIRHTSAAQIFMRLP